MVKKKTSPQTRYLLPVLLLLILTLACGKSAEVVEEQTSSPTTQPKTTQNLPDLEVISHRTIEAVDHLSIIGVIQNNTDAPISFITIDTIIYNTRQEAFAKETGYSMLDVIPPQGTAPFKITSNEWQEAATYDLRVQGQIAEPAAGALDLNSFAIYEEGESLFIIGEVINNDPENARTWVSAVTTLYDKQDDIMNADFAFTLLGTLPPSGKSPFILQIKDNWQNYDYYTIQIEGDKKIPLPKKVEVQELESWTDDQGGCYIGGKVSNISQDTLAVINVAASFYDENGEITGAAKAQADDENIAPQAASTFTLYTPYCPNVARFEVQAEG